MLSTPLACGDGGLLVGMNDDAEVRVMHDGASYVVFVGSKRTTSSATIDNALRLARYACDRYATEVL